MLTETPLKEKKATTKVDQLKTKLANSELAIQKSPHESAKRIADQILEIDERLSSQKQD